MADISKINVDGIDYNIHDKVLDGKLTELEEKVEDNVEKLDSIETVALGAAGAIESLAEVEKVEQGFDSLPLLAGQPMKLFGNGTPSVGVVPTNWKQFKDGGYDWNGTPSALGQEYINVDATTGGHYIAVRDGKYGLKWLNC
jgi:hypothetical protein